MVRATGLMFMRRSLPTRAPSVAGLTFGGAMLALQLLIPPAWSQQSALLETVKQNPQKGRTLCQQLRQLNGQGVSFMSAQVTTMVASEQNLSPADAEVLVTYVVGFYCPDLR